MATAAASTTNVSSYCDQSSFLCFRPNDSVDGDRDIATALATMINYCEDQSGSLAFPQNDPIDSDSDIATAIWFSVFSDKRFSRW